jgi:hypothetical protein
MGNWGCTPFSASDAMPPEGAGGIDIASCAIHPMVVRRQTVLSSIFKLAATGEKFLQLTDVRT